MTKEEALQEKLRNGDKKVLEQIYSAYKPSFINYFKARTDATFDVEDLFQDSIIDLFQSFFLRKIQLKKSTIKTYLFAIGKNKLMASFKKQQIFSEEELKIEKPYFTIDKELFNEKQKQLAKGYQELGEKCKEMLRLYYYRGLTDKEILAKTSYKDVNTIKSYRSRCLKKLKEIIHGERK